MSICTQQRPVKKMTPGKVYRDILGKFWYEYDSVYEVANENVSYPLNGFFLLLKIVKLKDRLPIETRYGLIILHGNKRYIQWFYEGDLFEEVI